MSDAACTTWPDERRAAQAARMRARNADPAFRERKAAGTQKYFSVGRPRPLPIPRHVHQLVRQLFEIINEEMAPLHEVGARSGLNRETIASWRSRHMPVLDAFEAALNSLDYELVIRKRKYSRLPR